MANVFLNLPLPAGNGAGAAVDTSSLGKEKTVTVAGSFTDPVTGAGPALSVQVSNDGGVTWAGIKTWSAIGKKTFSVAAQFMRTFVQNFNPLIPLSANVDVASNDDGGMFAVLPVPPGEGVGATVDVSAFGTFNTVIVDGSFSGALHIEISEDGIAWSECFTFATNGGLRSKDFVARFMRTTRTPASTPVAGLAVVSVGAINDGGGGSGVDEKVKATAADTTTGFLADKLAAGDGIALALLNPGANEEIEIRVEGADAGEILTGDPITVRGPTNDEGVGAEIARAGHQHRLEYEVEDEGVLVSARPRMDFVGDGVGAVDIPGEDLTRVTIPGPNLGDGGAVVKRSLYKGDEVTTSGNGFVDAMSGGTVVVPIDGDYWVIFEGEGMNSNANAVMEIGVSVNSTAVAMAGSERDSQGNASDHRPVITTVQLPGLVAGDLIRVVFRKKSGAQSVALMRRHLSIFKVQ